MGAPVDGRFGHRAAEKRVGEDGREQRVEQEEGAAVSGEMASSSVHPPHGERDGDIRYDAAAAAAAWVGHAADYRTEEKNPTSSGETNFRAATYASTVHHRGSRTHKGR